MLYINNWGAKTNEEDLKKKYMVITKEALENKLAWWPGIDDDEDIGYILISDHHVVM